MDGPHQHRACPPSEELVAFVEGRLRNEALGNFESHVEACSGCRRLLSAVNERSTDLSELALGSNAVTARFRHARCDHRGRLLPGDAIGRYEVRSLLGTGGMGEVYLCADPKLRRLVAVKRLRQTAFTTSERARIVREAQLMARLSHPNVLPVFDVVVEREQIFIAMQYARGGTLRGWLEERPRSWREVLVLFRAAARGLAAAHRAGIVHRDFKPDNVLLDELDGHSDHVFVVDFGLARDTSDVAVETSVPSTTDEGERLALDSGLTQTGMLLGTPVYMAPEQHQGHRVGPEADQFAFCVALWEACYGTRPFPPTSIGELGEQKRAGVLPPPPTQPALPKTLHAILKKGLSPRPEDRFESFDALAEALEAVDGNRRRLPLFLGAAACIVPAALWLADGAACDDVSPTTDALWNASIRQQLRASFHETRGAYGLHAARTIEREVDAYVAAWTDARTQLCRAGADEPHFDQRMHCLERSRGRLQTMLTALQRPTSPLIDGAVESTRELAPPRECLAPTLEYLTSRPFERLDLPPDALPVRRLLDEAEAHRQNGHFEEASTAGVKAVELARQIGAAPELLAQALLDHSESLQARSALDELEAAAREAFFLAQESGHDRLVIDAAARLVDAYTLGSDLPRAATWLRELEVAVVRSGFEPSDARLLAQQQAKLSYYQRDFDEGLAAASRAVALARQHETEEETLAKALNLHAVLLGASGDHARARALYEEVIAIRRAYLAPDHPVLLDARLSRADLNRALGKVDAARAELRALLAIQEQSEAPLDRSIAQTLMLLAAVEAPKDAIPHARRAIAIFETVYGSERMDNLSAREVLARALIEDGRLDEARLVVEKTSAIRQRLVGSEHASHISDLLTLADIETQRGQFDRAFEAAHEAIALSRRFFGEDHEFHAFTRCTLGWAHRAAGNVDEACEILASALPILHRAYGRSHTATQTVAMDVSACLLDDGKPEEALVRLEELVADLTRTLPSASIRGRLVRAEANLHLARTYAALGRHEDARQAAQRARRHVQNPQTADEAKVERDILAFLESS